jgi:AraC-like DNA-binding protein
MELAFADLRFEAPALRTLVRSAWSASYPSTLESMPGVIAPDAHVEFVFQTGSPCATQASGTATPSPPAMVFAQRHGTLRLKPTGANAIIAFRALPAVASAILGRPLGDCWDRPVALSDLIGRDADRLLDRLAAAPASTQAALLEAWLIGRLSGWEGEHARNLRLQYGLLWRSGGESVSALADRVGVTARTLRRHFMKHAGLSPKQMSLSGRILRACALLSDRRETKLAELALKVGFGDQAAFTNAFRHFVGMTPGQLRAEPLVFCERPPG